MARILFALVVIILLGGVAFLASWDMPPPTATTEKVISHERPQ
ncbi:MAG: hypothetical protein SFV19_02230 [Rhodospirillaceae bacterium]|nr:hypothetical protein [Rhodospirillaceae bacterium]